MNRIFTKLIKILLIFTLVIFASYKKVYADETETILNELQDLKEDIKTLEKAVYSKDVNTATSTIELSTASNDVLTKHLLKLSDLEEQFRNLTNSFEEVNFKLDKLSSRITKVQTDNQMRFQDIEKSGLGNNNITANKEKTLPGSGEQQDLGGVSDSDIAAMEQIQKTQSIETVGTVVTETASRAQKYYQIRIQKNNMSLL